MSQKRLRILFYSLWIIAAVAQAYFQGLNDDEGYYWRWSQHLAWGYFDHPPVIAWIIAAGFALFKNQLGVRLVTVIFSTLSIFLLERIIKPKDLKLFYVIVASISMIHTFSTLTKPEAPLFFFSVAFFYLYQRFLEKNSLSNALLLGMTIGLLFLSKQTGVLIVIFTIISNLRLLKNRYFWYAVGVSLILAAPHVIWQIDNSFPSLRFQAVERAGGALTLPLILKKTLSYFIELLSIGNPVVFFFYWYALVKIKPENYLEKSLKYNYFGLVLFFLLVSYKQGYANYWLYATLIPYVYYGYKFLSVRPLPRKIVLGIFPAMIFVLLAVRLFDVVDFLPESKVTHDWKGAADKHRWSGWSQELLAVAGDRPVLFLNNYRPTGEYTFYTGKFSATYNEHNGRKDQFDIWDSVDALRGKEVVLVSENPLPGSAKFGECNYEGGHFDNNYRIISNFQGYAHMDIIADNMSKTVGCKQKIELNLRLQKWNGQPGMFHADGRDPSYIVSIFYRGDRPVLEQKTKIKETAATASLPLQLEAPAAPGEYTLQLSVLTQDLPVTTASEKMRITVK